MNGTRHVRPLRGALLVLQVFITLGAVYGGALLTLEPRGTTLGLSPTLLHDTPFGNYLIPGAALLFVIGGGHLYAAWATLRDRPVGPGAALVMGLTTTLWIVAQVTWIGLTFWMQPLILVVGLTELLLGLGWRRQADPTGTAPTQPHRA